MYRSIVIGLAALATSALPMFGDMITPDGSYHEFQFGLGTSAVFSCGGICAPTTNPVAEQATSPPWTFSGPANVLLLDLFEQGDRFQIFDSGAPLGVTSVVSGAANTCGDDIACAIADLGYSRGNFMVGAGAHSITIDVIWNAEGQTGGAAVFSVTTVPEPSTLVLLVGVIAVAFALRRFAPASLGSDRR